MFASPAFLPRRKPDALEIATDQAIAACDGDPRAALRALIVAIGLVQSELNSGAAASQDRARQMKWRRSSR